MEEFDNRPWPPIGGFPKPNLSSLTPFETNLIYLEYQNKERFLGHRTLQQADTSESQQAWTGKKYIGPKPLYGVWETNSTAHCNGNSWANLERPTNNLRDFTLSILSRKAPKTRIDFSLPNLSTARLKDRICRRKVFRKWWGGKRGRDKEDAVGKIPSLKNQSNPRATVMCKKTSPPVET